jgi:hypothetical protein
MYKRIYNGNDITTVMTNNHGDDNNEDGYNVKLHISPKTPFMQDIICSMILWQIIPMAMVFSRNSQC